MIDEVRGGSPAAAAGLELGDQVCRFAGVVAGASGGAQGGASGAAATPGDELQRVAAALRAREGAAVEVVVLRQGRREELAVTPRRWAGDGLLGARLRPIGRPA